MLFIEKGAENLLRRDDALRLTYLEIPALLHLDVLRRRRNAVFLLAGPSVAFTLRAAYEDDGVTEDVKNDVGNVDVGSRRRRCRNRPDHVRRPLHLGRADRVPRRRSRRHVQEPGTFTLMAGIRFGGGRPVNRKRLPSRDVAWPLQRFENLRHVTAQIVRAVLSRWESGPNSPSSRATPRLPDRC